MQKPKPPPPPPPKKSIVSERCFAISVTLTLVLMCALGIPLAAILPPRTVEQLPINIIVPLYMSPDFSNWDPLYDAAIRYENTNFTVIVNPANGPGTPPEPGYVYVQAIQRLNQLPNVQAVGYIQTNRGNRTNETVYSDIDVYGQWAKKHQLGVHGIFFHHTPVEDSPHNRGYLKNITKAVRNTTGILAPQTVIFNPGAIPNVNLTHAGADVTIIYEGSYFTVPKQEELKTRLSNITGTRPNYGMLVLAMPTNIRRPDLRRLINDARRDIGYLYATDLYEGYYENWGGKWWDFVDLVPS
ncbi:Spherulation-specific family 4 [Lophiotrema nucula]|uniref:Spherulation-specific family 4 n=1 Tax=Lophiotrema nucula TaxID=690887 RepID=A0A6A5YLW0_9PLEO|nr:Spherulation-specific family 4 [Lophiotrema nucula]